jgi:glycosyltransferase involved in cell wall biosynthesis
VRILYYYSHQTFESGSPKVLASMVDTLDRTRIEPFFWARSEGPLVGELERRGVTILRGPAGSVSLRRPFEAMREVRARRRALEAAGIEILHVNEFSRNLDLALAARQAGIPVILHAHNPIRVDRLNLDARFAARVLFVSEAHRSATSGLEQLHGRSMVLHNPLDLDHYASGHSLRASLGLADDDIVVLTVGQIEPRKGTDLLMAAAARLAERHPRLRVLVAGQIKPGHEDFAARCMEQGAELPLAGRVRFLGSRNDVPDLLRTADLFVLPTRHETFGLVVGEAMAASVPVITTRVGGVPEVTGEADAAVLLDPDDLPGLVREMDRLLGAGAERTALGRRGRASIERRFGREVFGRKLEALYQELQC